MDIREFTETGCGQGLCKFSGTCSTSFISNVRVWVPLYLAGCLQEIA